MPDFTENRIRMLTVSDRVETMLYEHFAPENFRGIELILSCGDLPPEYLSFLVTVFNVPLFYVRGNHDAGYGVNPPLGCTDIHGKIVSFKGFKFLGIEGSRWYNGGPLQYSERKMQRIARNMNVKIWLRKGVDVVITHAPPRHVHDGEDPCHRGFKSYRKLIERHAPGYFVHGHVHRHFENAAQRISMVGETRVINTFGYTIIDMGPEEQKSG